MGALEGMVDGKGGKRMFGPIRLTVFERRFRFLTAHRHIAWVCIGETVNFC